MLLRSTFWIASVGILQVLVFSSQSQAWSLSEESQKYKKKAIESFLAGIKQTPEDFTVVDRQNEPMGLTYVQLRSHKKVKIGIAAFPKSTLFHLATNGPMYAEVESPITILGKPAEPTRVTFSRWNVTELVFENQTKFLGKVYEEGSSLFYFKGHPVAKVTPRTKCVPAATNPQSNDELPKFIVSEDGRCFEYKTLAAYKNIPKLNKEPNQSFELSNWSHELKDLMVLEAPPEATFPDDTPLTLIGPFSHSIPALIVATAYRGAETVSQLDRYFVARPLIPSGWTNLDGSSNSMTVLEGHLPQNLTYKKQTKGKVWVTKNQIKELHLEFASKTRKGKLGTEYQFDLDKTWSYKKDGKYYTGSIFKLGNHVFGKFTETNKDGSQIVPLPEYLNRFSPILFFQFGGNDYYQYDSTGKMTQDYPVLRKNPSGKFRKIPYQNYPDGC